MRSRWLSRIAYRSWVSFVSNERPDANTLVLVAERGVSAWSWGELVRIRMRSLTHATTELSVFTRPKLLTNITADWDYAPKLFTKVDLKLERRAK